MRIQFVIPAEQGGADNEVREASDNKLRIENIERAVKNKEKISRIKIEIEHRA